jgi:hypothetical protein
MGHKEKSLVKKAIDFYNQFAESHSDIFVFHNQRFLAECLQQVREFSKGEDIHKDEYETGLVAMILSVTGQQQSADKQWNNQLLAEAFLEQNSVPAEECEAIREYISFFQTNRAAKNEIEKMLRDAKYGYLGSADALERLSLLRVQEKNLYQNDYTELGWLEKCKDYFIRHGFETRYAQRNYGGMRNKNYLELEKRIDKLKTESLKEQKEADKEKGTEPLSGKEGDDLFKIAFRNYLNLVDLADKKAGLLIQVNTILASVVGAFGIKRLDTTPFYAIPTAAVLIGSAVTIFFAILASKPLGKKFFDGSDSGKEAFFFGSFDRLDPGFKYVSWEKYSSDMTQFFKGQKIFIFDEMIRESFEVRKVLSQKFNYLSIAYKVFFAALLIGILGYLAVLIYEYNFYEQMK